MADVVKSFRLLFDRPNEPLITPKGEDGTLFQLTEDLLVSIKLIRFWELCYTRFARGFVKVYLVNQLKLFFYPLGTVASSGWKILFVLLWALDL